MEVPFDQFDLSPMGLMRTMGDRVIPASSCNCHRRFVIVLIVNFFASQTEYEDDHVDDRTIRNSHVCPSSSQSSTSTRTTGSESP
jgi:hypothetical protein